MSCCSLMTRAHTVISPLESEKDDMERLYDTDLMLGGGRAAATG